MAELSHVLFFFSSRRRHTRYWRDWSSDVCSSDLIAADQRDRLQFFQEDAMGGFQRRHIRTVVELELEVGGDERHERRAERAGRVGRKQRVERTLLDNEEIGRASCRERG